MKAYRRSGIYFVGTAGTADSMHLPHTMCTCCKGRGDHESGQRSSFSSTPAGSVRLIIIIARPGIAVAIACIARQSVGKGLFLNWDACACRCVLANGVPMSIQSWRHVTGWQAHRARNSEASVYLRSVRSLLFSIQRV